MKKNIDPQTAKLFEAARAAYIDNYSVGVIKSPIAKNVTAAEIGRYFAWIAEDKNLERMIPTCYTYAKQEYQRRRRAIAKNIEKCGYTVTLQDEAKVINLIEGYQCGIMALPRIYAELCRLVGEKPIELAAWPINEATAPAEAAAPVDVPSESPAPVEDAPAAPAAAGYMSGETTRGLVHYVNHQDKAVSRVMDLERVNYPAPLPMWVMADGDYYYMVYQLADGLFFRPNNSGFTALNMEAFRGDYSQFSEETISEALANSAAIPAEHFNHKWPNMAVVNAYKAAGMVKEADMLMAVREKIEQEYEEEKKAWKEKAEREEKERKQEEENRLNEAAAAMVNNGRITGRDIVALCDREGIAINPRTRHNLLEVVNYYEDNRICYKQYGKRKPGLDGCFNVARELLAALTAKLPADAAEDAAPRYLLAPVEIYQQINNIIAAAVPAPQLPEPPAVVYVSEPCPPTPSTLTDADVLATAARIKETYEAMKQQAAADTFADAITAYCDSLEESPAPAWEPETIIIKPVYHDAAPVAAPRRRLHIGPRLTRWLHPVRIVAAVFAVLVLSLVLGSSAGAFDTPADNAAADAVAMTPAAALPVAVDADTLQVVELPPVTVTAPRTPSGQKTGLTPSGQKTAAAVADASPTDEPTADTPAGQKTDADGLPDTLQPDSQPHGLTICEGTAWAYTMMNWA